jgi:hypothetical protein
MAQARTTQRNDLRRITGKLLNSALVVDIYNKGDLGGEVSSV